MAERADGWWNAVRVLWRYARGSTRPRSAPVDPAELGVLGEREAERFLKRRGFRIYARNYRSTKGEVDLIARDKRADALVFVEVKTRRRGQPAEAVTPEKWRRVAHAARAFRRLLNARDLPHRFDIVAVVWPEGAERPTVEHIPDAHRPRYPV